MDGSTTRPGLRNVRADVSKRATEDGLHNVEVAGEDDRRVDCGQFGGMRYYVLERCALAVDLGTGTRVAVREVKAADEDAADRRLELAALVVIPGAAGHAVFQSGCRRGSEWRRRSSSSARAIARHTRLRRWLARGTGPAPPSAPARRQCPVRLRRAIATAPADGR